MCLLVQFLIQVAHIQLSHWNLAQVLHVVVLVGIDRSFLQVLFVLDAGVLEGCFLNLGIAAIVPLQFL